MDENKKDPHAVYAEKIRALRSEVQALFPASRPVSMTLTKLDEAWLWLEAAKNDKP